LPEDTFRALIARVRAGDEEAAAALLRNYQSALTRMIRVRLVDPRLRKVVGESDIFQSVMGTFFVRAALGQYELETPEDLLRLLAVLTRNKVADQARRRPVEQRGEAIPFDEIALPSGEESPSRQLRLRELARLARQRLSPQLLEVLELRERGMDWTSIGAQFGESAGAIRKRFARAIDEIAGVLASDATP
jgi:RNA polymerase sigma-70 factor (ECF subfamily)